MAAPSMMTLQHLEEFQTVFIDYIERSIRMIDELIPLAEHDAGHHSETVQRAKQFSEEGHEYLDSENKNKNDLAVEPNNDTGDGVQRK